MQPPDSESQSNPTGQDGPPASSPADPASPGFAPAAPSTSSIPPTPLVADSAAGGWQPQPRQRRGRIASIGVGVVAVVGFLLVKVLPGFLVATVAAGALSSVFGGPYDRLPSDFRQGIEARYAQAFPDLKNASSDQVDARVSAAIQDGLPRLDDDSLTRYWVATAAAFGATDTATCAAIVRAEMSGGDASGLYRKLADTLDQPHLEALIDVSVSAAEASVRQSPARRTVTEAEASGEVSRVMATLTPAQISAFVALVEKQTVSDADACNAWKAFLGSVSGLAPADRATVIRYIIS